MSNEVVPEDRWETHDYVGLFSIDLPLGIQPEQGDDGTALSFPLPTSQRSEVILGVFPTPNNERVTPLVIRSEIERFITQCAGVDNASFETPADFDKEGFIAYQTVGVDLLGRWWIARLYGRRGGRTMLLAHWVGQEMDVREHVLPMLISINPELKEQDAEN